MGQRQSSTATASLGALGPGSAHATLERGGPRQTSQTRRVRPAVTVVSRISRYRFVHAPEQCYNPRTFLPSSVSLRSS